MKSNILIVEDHELTRFGLKTAFESCDFIETIYEMFEMNNVLILRRKLLLILKIYL